MNEKIINSELLSSLNTFYFSGDEALSKCKDDGTFGDEYRKFIENKLDIVEQKGFEINQDDLHPSTYLHQRDAILWAAKMGRGLIAMSFGLGKTAIQIELAQAIHKQTEGKCLIICPLGVKHQFAEVDGPRLGTTWEYVTCDGDILMSDTPYLITNYERCRDGDIDPKKHNFAFVSLDEGSVLRSLGSKTYQTFNKIFANVPHRFVCTATPSPNRFRELIYYAEFLDIMDKGQALTRFFQRDTSKAGNLTLHPQHEEAFWLWVASWALFIYKPSDLGYSDEGYDVPPLNVHWHRIGVDHTRAWAQTDNQGQHRLFLDAAGGVREAAAEKRETIPERVEYMLDLLDDDKHWLIWHHLEAERKAIERAVDDAVTVYGSQTLEKRERGILDFSDGKIRILATKPEIAGSGCNFQHHCYNAVYLGVNYKFQDFIQSVHRIHRFQQTKPVTIHIIYAESEDQIVTVLKQKWEQHNILTAKMQGIVKKYGLVHEALKGDLKRSIGVAREAYSGKLFEAVNNDCVAEVQRLPSNYFGGIGTSIPFGNHYEYTAKSEDFGHNATNADFWDQMDFLIPDLYRVLKPGRVAWVHVKERVLYGHQTKHGFMEIAPFPDECQAAFRKHGFIYMGRRVIVTDVVRENNSTYRLGWTEMAEGDATKMGSGLPEYVLLFRKPPTSNDTARADEPVVKSKTDYTRGRWQVDAHNFWRSDGNRPLMPDELRTYDYEAHVDELNEKDQFGNLPASWFYAPPESPSEWVWTDIQFMQGLNANQSRKRNEQHICPLPFDIVDRLIMLYSNPGDKILDPFAGLFTVPYCAMKLDRYGYGVELNEQYYADGLQYCQDMEAKKTAPTLFDWLEQQSKDVGASVTLKSTQEVDGD